VLRRDRRSAGRDDDVESISCKICELFYLTATFGQLLEFDNSHTLFKLLSLCNATVSIPIFSHRA
jgi:hypothetical protein